MIMKDLAPESGAKVFMIMECRPTATAGLGTRSFLDGPGSQDEAILRMLITDA
jgi:hypothetical protein